MFEIQSRTTTDRAGGGQGRQEPRKNPPIGGKIRCLLKRRIHSARSKSFGGGAASGASDAGGTASKGFHLHKGKALKEDLSVSG
ncbi:hypothetical protein A2765_03355 [Candidatus Kaiserbacteria bacterium RIFCSPHIGHO2_01_FULL_56_24]|uniref:Uncharacterized protein n=1 Tax=Candidatus Kaiserbacteria bacterium RIFCSPHIGHO2_01_FULL_56_24 TaxID=1798487 RepID=A0A1F6DCT9_9BACT|nr:MAG: hypothetical protein A2765_03355 [Candidatus Kaiserbacteria bacterium RIFCSPHIGHO2_01_FULL_56_24]